jgi:hypothetical protein
VMPRGPSLVALSCPCGVRFYHVLTTFHEDTRHFTRVYVNLRTTLQTLRIFRKVFPGNGSWRLRPGFMSRMTH